MADCKIGSILNIIGSQNSSDLNPWCDGNYKKDNNFSLSNNEACTVSSTAFPKYPKGSAFTCKNGSITSVKLPDGSIVALPPPSAAQDSTTSAAESNSMTIIIVIVLLLAVGGGAFMFMRKSKVSSMTAFGRKLSKMTRMRR